MGERIFRLVARLVLPRAVDRPLRQDLLETHRAVMAEAAGAGRSGRRYARELVDLLRAGVDLRARPPRRVPGGRVPDPGATGPHGDRPRARAWPDDLRHAIRSLVRHPAHTLSVVGTLALGLGASTAVYSAIRHTLVQPIPYEGADRYVSLWRTLGAGSMVPPTEEQVELWSGQQDLVEGVVRFRTVQPTLTGRGEPRILIGTEIDAGHFAFLGASPVMGREFVPEETVADGPRVAMLGYGLWKESFGGDPGVLGTTVTLDGEPWTVVGVGPRDAPLPNGFPEPRDVWLPRPPGGRASTVVRLRPDVTVEAYRERIDTLVARAAAATSSPPPGGGTAMPAAELVATRLGNSLRMLAVAVGMLLVIGWLNVAGLLVNRADRRRREVAVRRALGASPARLRRQHVIESLILGVGGGLAGLALAAGLVHTTRLLRPESFALLDRMTLDAPVTLFAFGLSVAVGLLFGVFPALGAGRSRGHSALREGARGTADRETRRGRWLLVTGEVALSYALLVGSALLVRSLLGALHQDVGFQPDGLVVAEVTLPSWRYEEEVERRDAWMRMRAAVAAVPGVEGAVLSNTVPSRAGAHFGTLEVEGRELDDEIASQLLFGGGVEPGHFELLGQRLVVGRAPTAAEVEDDAPVYVVGEETARRLWPGEDPVGRRMRVGGGTWYTVIGVAADVPTFGLASDWDELFQFYTPFQPYRSALVLLRLRDEAAGTLPLVRERVRQVVPEARMELNRAGALLDRSVATERFTMRLLLVLAGVALLLASVGLYAVVSQTVGRRMREIGIRIALGARQIEIGWMILRTGILSVGLGLLAGGALALAGRRVIASQLHDLAPADPASYAAGAAALALAALAAVWIPSRRAAAVDPVRAIASE